MNNPRSIEKITTRLKNINFIQSYSIQELSSVSAKIKIRYLGKIKNIQDSFANSGFNFEIINDEWVLSLES